MLERNLKESKMLERNQKTFQKVFGVFWKSQKVLKIPKKF